MNTSFSRYLQTCRQLLILEGTQVSQTWDGVNPVKPYGNHEGSTEEVHTAQESEHDKSLQTPSVLTFRFSEFQHFRWKRYTIECTVPCDERISVLYGIGTS